MISLFSQGFRGLSDTLFSGVKGAVYRAVGIDSRSEPGKIKVHQKLTKDSSTTIDELCKASVSVSDGSKLWFSSESGKIWREVSGVYTLVYTLVIEAYNLITAQFVDELDVNAKANNPLVQIKGDGTKMFLVKFSGAVVNEYTLSEAFDITTATFVDAFTPSGQTNDIDTLFVRADGLKMYLSDNGVFYQYALSTAWDVSTASYETKTVDLADETESISNVWFKSDGTILYILESSGDVLSFGLGTAWDITTIEGEMDLLVVGGGGGAASAAGGNNGRGGGGGAGELLPRTLFGIKRSYAISVGDGGVGGVGTGISGTKGEDSSFDSFFTAEGGGFGAALGNTAGNGGSGGGAHDGTAGTGNFNGGRQTVDGTGNRGGGGGGGSSANGGSTSTDAAGTGGAGTSSSISGSSVTYAAGGKGGAYGTVVAAVPGAANTGNGGGASDGTAATDGGNGGSGVVIISYPTGSITATGGTITTSGGNTIHTFTTDGTFEITAVGAAGSTFAKAEGQVGSGNHALALSADGTKMFIGDTGGIIYQYVLSTPWDIATASFDNQGFSLDSYGSVGAISIDFDTTGTRMYVGMVNDGTVLQFSIGGDGESVKTLSATEFRTKIGYTDTFAQHIIWTVDNYVFRIDIAELASWVGNVFLISDFANGDDTYHPMAEVNNGLFIGDNKVIAKLSDTAVFTKETDFNILEPERITAVEPFDVDLLVGTKTTTGGRVLRWDTESLSWSAEDGIYVKGGVSTFLHDDNYVYVLDKEGYIWFYNGEQNELYTRIPGVGDGEIKVNANAVGYWRGVPLFGLSNESGNTVLQGVYGFGKYSRSYKTSLSLDFPMSSGEFSGVEIGTIEVDGRDLYVAWKDGQDVGVAKLDYTAKYASAYMETMTLADANTRHQVKTITDAMVPYYSKPASTSITIGYKKAYEASFTDYPMVDDTKRKLVRPSVPSVPDVANPQLRVTFGVNNNDAPEVEDLLLDLAPVGKK